MVQAIVEQISSHGIRELNVDVSKMNMGEDSSMRMLAVVDNIVQRPNLAHLEGLNILGGADVVLALRREVSFGWWTEVGWIGCADA